MISSCHAHGDVAQGEHVAHQRAVVLQGHHPGRDHAPLVAPAELHLEAVAAGGPNRGQALVEGRGLDPPPGVEKSRVLAHGAVQAGAEDGTRGLVGVSDVELGVGGHDAHVDGRVQDVLEVALARPPLGLVAVARGQAAHRRLHALQAAAAQALDDPGQAEQPEHLPLAVDHHQPAHAPAAHEGHGPTAGHSGLDRDHRGDMTASGGGRVVRPAASRRTPSSSVRGPRECAPRTAGRSRTASRPARPAPRPPEPRAPGFRRPRSWPRTRATKSRKYRSPGAWASSSWETTR